MSGRATERFIAWPHSWLDKTNPLWAKRKDNPRWISAFLFMNHRAAYKGFTYKPKRAKEGIYLGRGELLMSHSLLAEETGMTVNQARYFLRFCHTQNHILKKVKETPDGNVYRIVGFGATGRSAQTFHTTVEERVTPQVTPGVTPEEERYLEREKRIDLNSSSLEPQKPVARKAWGAKPDRPVTNRPAQPTTTGANGGLERGLELYAQRLRASGMPEHEIERAIALRRKRAPQGVAAGGSR